MTSVTSAEPEATFTRINTPFHVENGTVTVSGHTYAISIKGGADPTSEAVTKFVKELLKYSPHLLRELGTGPESVGASLTQNQTGQGLPVLTGRVKKLSERERDYEVVDILTEDQLRIIGDCFRRIQGLAQAEEPHARTPPAQQPSVTSTPGRSQRLQRGTRSKASQRRPIGSGSGSDSAASRQSRSALSSESSSSDSESGSNASSPKRVRSSSSSGSSSSSSDSEPDASSSEQSRLGSKSKGSSSSESESDSDASKERSPSHLNAEPDSDFSPFHDSSSSSAARPSSSEKSRSLSASPPRLKPEDQRTSEDRSRVVQKRASEIAERTRDLERRMEEAGSRPAAQSAWDSIAKPASSPKASSPAAQPPLQQPKPSTSSKPPPIPSKIVFDDSSDSDLQPPKRSKTKSPPPSSSSSPKDKAPAAKGLHPDKAANLRQPSADATRKTSRKSEDVKPAKAAKKTEQSVKQELSEKNDSELSADEVMNPDFNWGSEIPPSTRSEPKGQQRGWYDPRRYFDKQPETTKSRHGLGEHEDFVSGKEDKPKPKAKKEKGPSSSIWDKNGGAFDVPRGGVGKFRDGAWSDSDSDSKR